MNEITVQAVEQALEAMFPYGAGQAPHTRVRHHLEQVAQVAYREGRNDALLGLMTAEDVAEHFQISPRRARALIANRHGRFGTGMRFGNSWLVHRDDLDTLQPDTKYHARVPARDGFVEVETANGTDALKAAEQVARIIEDVYNSGDWLVPIDNAADD